MTSSLALKTTCVEGQEALGGTCLNVGCIPSNVSISIPCSQLLLKDHEGHLHRSGRHHLDAYLQVLHAIAMSCPLARSVRTAVVGRILMACKRCCMLAMFVTK